MTASAWLPLPPTPMAVLEHIYDEKKRLTIEALAVFGSNVPRQWPPRGLASAWLGPAAPGDALSGFTRRAVR